MRACLLSDKSQVASRKSQVASRKSQVASRKWSTTGVRLGTWILSLGTRWRTYGRNGPARWGGEAIPARQGRVAGAAGGRVSGGARRGGGAARAIRLRQVHLAPPDRRPG